MPDASADRASQIGILAYGSLLSEPGTELHELLTARLGGVETPFRVEFARACSCRDNAPTLAPVESGGAPVHGAILTAEPCVSEEAIKDALWRRETREQRWEEATSPESRDLLIRRASSLERAYGLEKVFFAHLEANIEELTPAHLADLAIESARSEAGRRGEDGIAYLLAIKENGISTPLLTPYEREILRKTEESSLEAAREVLVE